MGGQLFHDQVKPALFFIIDGNAVVYRHQHAPFLNLRSPDGEPTKATYQFVQMLLAIERTFSPEYLAVVFDHQSGASSRQLIDPAYKSNRNNDPEKIKFKSETIHPQITRISEICRAMGIKVFCEPNVEADDVIATLVKRCVSEAVHCVVVGMDKDLAPLLADHRVMMFDPRAEDLTDAKKWKLMNGLPPQYGPDLLAFMGDRVDGIPPVGGIGEKRAVTLLNQAWKQFSRDGIYGVVKCATEGKFSAAMNKRILAAVDSGRLELNMRLIRLDDAVPISLNYDELEFDGLDMDAARPIFQMLAFKRWS